VDQVADLDLRQAVLPRAKELPGAAQTEVLLGDPEAV
jgi:hypothetical protein